jgi:hypothetical protein
MVEAQTRVSRHEIGPRIQQEPQQVTSMRRLYELWADSKGLNPDQRKVLLDEASTPEFNHFPFTQEEFNEPIMDIHGEAHTPVVLYKSEALADTEIFGKVFPYLKLQGTNGRLTINEPGWVKVEGEKKAPNTKTSVPKVEKFFNENGLQGQDIVTYAILLDIDKRRDEAIERVDPLDEGTASHLLSASKGELVIDTRVPQFDAFGGRAGQFKDPMHVSEGFGARSEQRKGSQK